MTTYKHGRSYEAPEQRELPVWLRYNKQLRQEGLAQLYAQALFVVDHLHIQSEYWAKPYMRNALPAQFDLSLLRHARRIVLHADIFTHAHSSAFEYAPPLCRACQNPIIEGPVTSMCWWLRQNCTSLRDLELHLNIFMRYITKTPPLTCQWCVILCTVPNQLWKQRMESRRGYRDTIGLTQNYHSRTISLRHLENQQGERMRLMKYA